ncbi:hypothetical protein RDI58_024240 [Solanum bulbocastanum]|uniref:Uncharacterized protein n=1 Tax=Solanum bulbocastanum TaxID=147425 RepID=A0AAN8Y5E9_SOLBU
MRCSLTMIIQGDRSHISNP